MKCSFPVVCVSIALLAASGAQAQSTKAGLWEVQSKMGGNPQMDQAMKKMQQQMASMSPAQRKMMEDMMGRQGVSVGAGAGGAMAVKVCITPEMATRQALPTQTDGDCTSKVTSQSGNTLKLSFVCRQPASTGEGTYTFRGDAAYDVSMLIHSQREGKPVSTTINGSGRWLSADCGQIKPVPMSAGK